jgi:starch synthase
VHIGYDEGLAHLLQGGADAILVPSRFEPCGLTQLCALRYGCVPMVARVGGLADTVIEANHAALKAGVATGLTFAEVTPEGVLQAIQQLVHLQRAGMRADVGWDVSAATYATLYRRLIQARHMLTQEPA